MKIVVRAGGTGTRLWPKSRKNMPKQFHQLIGEKTLLQQTFERARKMGEASDIFVSTNKDFSDLVLEQLPELPPENLIIEPAKRDTGPAIGLESVILSRRFPGEIVWGMHSDHYVDNVDELTKVVFFGEAFLKTHPEHILCVGIRPGHASTSFGYIQMGEELARERNIRLFRIAAFKEKPDQQTAHAFYSDWRYLWNAGYFMWRPEHVLHLIQRYAPDTYEKLMQIDAAFGQENFSKVVEEIFPTITPQAIDYMIMEKNDQMVVIPADIGWNDIGDWKVLGEIGKQTPATHLAEDSQNVVVVADPKKLIATVGLENIVIVDTPDALLICDAARTQDVKKLVERMKETKHLERYL